MAFPNYPTNGQSTTVDGINYTYSSAENSWTRQTLVLTTDATASPNTVILQGVDVTQNTRISVLEGVNTTQNTNITTVTGLAQAAFDKANTGVSTSTDDYARTLANTATNNIVILQGVDTTQNTRLAVVEGGLISANANTVHLNSLITTNNTRISVIEGGLISANANTVYLNSLITTNNTRISSVNTTSSAAYAKANTNISSDLTLTVTNSGSGAYVIGGASNPTVTLYRGVTYYFSINASGHPFFIQTVSGGYSSGNLYTSGVTGAGTQVGTLTFTVPLDAPSNLYYVCQFHSSMNGAFLIENLISTVNTQNTNITILQGVNTTQNTNITTVTGLAQAAFDKANTGVTTSTDDYARTTANTATNNITILQGVNTTQNTNITYATNLAQAAYNQANTGGSGGLVSNTGIITVDTFVGNGSNVAFTLSVTPITKNYTSITIEGTSQLKDSYSLSGNIITFSEAPLNGDNVEVVSFTSGIVESQDNVARIIANTATSNIAILQGIDVTQNTRLSVVEGGLISANANTVYLNSLITTNNTRITVIEGVNTTQNTNITTVTGLAQAAFDKANTGVSTSTDDYARTTANTATNNITILQGVNTTQNTNITYGTNLAQAAYNQANTGGLVSNTGIITVDTFTGDGSTVAFTLSVTPVTKNYTSITIDGATQLKSAYSLSGNIVTLSGAPLTGENIEVISFTNGVITSYDTVARDIANTATNNITILQGVNTSQNTRITSADNTATAAYAKANAAFDKANTGVTSSIDDYARTTSNTATNNITIIQGVNATQNANITYVISLAQAAYNQANTGSGGSSNVTIATSDSFVGDGSNVAYILSVTPSSKDYTFVNFDGTVQLRSSYSLSGNTITFTEAPLVGENIEVTSFSANSSLSGASSGTTIGKAIAMSIIFGG